MSAVDYTPEHGSTAWNVIEFLTTNRGEELTPADIEVKFGKHRSQVHSLLAKAVDTGVLVRKEESGGDGLVYKLGRGHPLVKPNTVKHPTLNAGRALAVSQAPAKRRPRLVIDVDAITLVDDVPLPIKDSKPRMTEWPKLFARMKPGQMAKVPTAAKATLLKAITVFHKENEGVELATRALDEDHLGVWRVK